MGVKISFKLCQENELSCAAIKFSETTGAYDPGNVTGWNSLIPADNISNVTEAHLYITQPDGTVITIDMLAEGFPTTDSNITYDITTYTLGITTADNLTAIPDGVYKFEYRVIVNAGGAAYVYRAIEYAVIVCQINCAINKKAASLSLCNCNCKEDESWSDFFYMKSVQKALCSIKNCEQNKTKIQDYIEHLQDILELDNTECGCIDSSNLNRVKTVKF